MRVAIDARKLHDFGIGTYVRNLVTELARLDGSVEYQLLCRSRDTAFVESLGPRFRALVETSGNYSLREQVSIPFALARARVDLFHAPHYVVSPLTLVRVSTSSAGDWPVAATPKAWPSGVTENVEARVSIRALA